MQWRPAQRRSRMSRKCVAIRKLGAVTCARRTRAARPSGARQPFSSGMPLLRCVPPAPCGAGRCGRALQKERCASGVGSSRTRHRRKITHRLLHLVWVLLLNVGTRPCAAQDAVPRLVLTEVGSTRLPGGLAVASAALGAGDSWVAWSGRQPGILLRDSARVRRACTASEPVAAGFTSNGSVQLVDAASRTIRVLDESGQCVSVHHLSTTAEVVGGALVGDDWILATVNRFGQSALLRVSASGNERNIPVQEHSVAARMRLRLSSLVTHRNGVLLSAMRWPFQWDALDSLGHVVASGRPFSHDSVLADWPRAPRRVNLVGLTTLDLGEGYLQLIADPRSDLRLLALYAEDGRIARTSVLQTPFGLLAANPSSHTLLALRRSDEVEVVVYHWRWEPAHNLEEER